MRTGGGNARSYRRRVSSIYYWIVGIMFLMIVSNFIAFGDRKNNFGLGSYKRMVSGWVDEQGNPFDFTDTTLYRTGIEEFSIYYKIPSNMRQEESIVFRTKSSSVKAYIEDELVYETYINEGPFYTESPGTRWNIITYGPLNAGNTIELRITLTYFDESSRIDTMYQGDRAAILIALLDDKGEAVLLCALMFITGILYYVAAAVLNYQQKEKDHSLIYLGSFATILALWCLMETNVLQLFYNNIRMLQVIDNMMLILGAVPFILYMDCLYGVFELRTVRIFCSVDLAYIIIATVLHVFGWYDYHRSLTAMLLGYGAIITFFCIYGIRHIKKYMNKRVPKGARRNYLIQQIGMAFLWVCITSDLVVYLCRGGLDYALFTRVGLLVFVLLFGFDNIVRLMGLVKQGLKTELISSLAYTDGLTKVGNRTAYMEHLEQIASKVPSEFCGIVICDINDLKEVNDEQGHAAGDQLIQACADMISSSFTGVGTVYRIGGDEFAVLMTGENVVLLYEYAVGELRRKMRQQPDISIAYGVSFCKETTVDNLHETEREADKKMYENKYLYKKKKNEQVDVFLPIC